GGLCAEYGDQKDKGKGRRGSLDHGRFVLRACARKGKPRRNRLQSALTTKDFNHKGTRSTKKRRANFCRLLVLCAKKEISPRNNTDEMDLQNGPIEFFDPCRSV